MDCATIVAAGERVLQRLNEHLVRWFGPDGVDALTYRAVERTQKSYPAMAQVRHQTHVPLQLTSVLEGVDAVGGPSSAELVESIASLIATILSLIGRLVGDDMTRHLVMQIWPESSGDELSNNDGSNKERLGK